MLTIDWFKTMRTLYTIYYYTVMSYIGTRMYIVDVTFI